MRVAVIGTGRMGTALGAQMAAAGHDVRVGSRDPERGRGIADEIGASFGGSYLDAAAEAEAIVLAVPWSAAPDALAQIGGRLDGAILIDVTNPAVKGDVPRPERSGAEEIEAHARGAHVVKAWNTLYSEVVRRAPGFDGTPATVFVAGDDAEAKESVVGLVRDLGYEAADAGPLSSARYLEPLAGLMTSLDRLSRGRVEHGLRLLRRPAPAAQTASGTSSKRSTSTRPRSVILRAGITDRARNASI